MTHHFEPLQTPHASSPSRATGMTLATFSRCSRVSDRMTEDNNYHWTPRLTMARPHSYPHLFCMHVSIRARWSANSLFDKCNLLSHMIQLVCAAEFCNAKSDMKYHLYQLSKSLVGPESLENVFNYLCWRCLLQRYFIKVVHISTLRSEA